MKEESGESNNAALSVEAQHVEEGHRDEEEETNEDHDERPRIDTDILGGEDKTTFVHGESLHERHRPPSASVHHHLHHHTHHHHSQLVPLATPTMRPWTDETMQQATMRRTLRRMASKSRESTGSSHHPVLPRRIVVENPHDVQLSNPNFRPYHPDDISQCTHLPTWWQLHWSRARLHHAGFFSISSCLVLALRLYLDTEPTAYLIHSIVIFVDMMLIHWCTYTTWLSLAGEVTTIIYLLAFHYTKETVYELLETTCIAALCSFHMIGSRHKHMDREEELETGIENLRQQCLYFLRPDSHRTNVREGMRKIQQQMCLLLHDTVEDFEQEQTMSHMQREDVQQPRRAFRREHSRHSSERLFMKRGSDDSDLECGAPNINNNGQSLAYQNHTQHDDDDNSSLSSKATLKVLESWFLQPNEEPNSYRDQICLWGAHLFEHFLDGSAGVMYTSFLGLIIDEIIKQVTDQDKKC